VERGQGKVPVADPTRLSKAAKDLFEAAVKADPNLGKYGTAFAFEVFAPIGALPIRNYATNIFPGWEKFKGNICAATLRSSQILAGPVAWATAVSWK